MADIQGGAIIITVILSRLQVNHLIFQYDKQMIEHCPKQRLRHWGAGGFNPTSFSKLIFFTKNTDRVYSII